MRLAYLVPLFALLLGGCISANTPGDLALASVRAVDWQEQEEMPGPGASPLVGMVNSVDLALMRQSVTGGEKPHRPLLKVEFTSATNLSKFAIENSFNLGNVSNFCDRPVDDVTLSFPYIFSHGNLLGQHETDFIQRDAAPARTLITYYVFIDVAREPRPRDRPPQEGYDLRQKPEDICVNLRGGNNSGRGYRSNTVVIPKDSIATALEKRPSR